PFLSDAGIFWQQHSSGQFSSGPWHETDAAGNAYTLEAFAIWAGASKIVCIQLLGPAHAAHQAILQAARETKLNYGRLQRTEEALRRSEAKLTDMLAQLEQSHNNLLLM